MALQGLALEGPAQPRQHISALLLGWALGLQRAHGWGCVYLSSTPLCWVLVLSLKTAFCPQCLQGSFQCPGAAPVDYPLGAEGGHSQGTQSPLRARSEPPSSYQMAAGPGTG